MTRIELGLIAAIICVSTKLALDHGVQASAIIHTILVWVNYIGLGVLVAMSLLCIVFFLALVVEHLHHARKSKREDRP